ncbi:sensor domain-containing phosphodiesterase [Vibrio azureus]|uniref:Putative signaling protein n=1 Tax=Vibrio azureus NBRC 104587 TaxID=1219077 RepID=U3AMC0_9VIBR|nr:sensor domain-containing phosphodiesterase [Vibrio azureus]AUI88189.1 sensor domain-containing phosphodiesterase [Vibrio azureus]GAD74915.1 putative signaling protein [Vibrio azureus NBRC 104587]
MSTFHTLNYTIPESVEKNWQSIVDLLAKTTNIPTTLIMRIYPEHIEVNTSSQIEGNPFQVGDKGYPEQSLYCEQVILNKQELVIPNALESKKLPHMANKKLGMISYCGLPLHWPNGKTFGTLCLLDSKANQYHKAYRQLLYTFKKSIETQLAIVFDQHRLARLNHELKNRVAARTTDLAKLSYSLTQEITRRKAAEEQINYQNTHDLGTGFLNTSATEEYLERALAELNGEMSSLTVLNIGFANARAIQTKYGFERLDEILQQFRSKLDFAESKHFVTGRLSSSDMVVIISGPEPKNVTHRLLENIAHIKCDSYNIDDQTVHLQTYTGIVQGNIGFNAKQLLQNACHAMTLCKESGKSYRYCSEENTKVLNQHNQLENYLLEAIRNDDVMIYFQPKVCSNTGEWIGAESSLRWLHPVLGDVSNDALMQMAEQNNLTHEISTFALRIVIEKAKQWSDTVKDFKVAINVSQSQLLNRHFLEKIEYFLAFYHLPPHCLELEISESALQENGNITFNALKTLNRLGVTLSLDGFGTSDYSFNYLKNCPFKAIKIDKSFIQQMNYSEEDKTIVRSIIHIAKKLNLNVMTDGIESAEQVQFLLQEGCDIGQGLFYAKPMPCHKFEQVLYTQQGTSGI